MRRKKFSRIISATLCGCLIGSSIVSGIGALEAQAQETSDSEWGAVSSILDSYPGVYTKDTRLSNDWNTTFSPDGPLMGNGTLYAFLAGDRKEQNFYISHSNMWKDRDSNNGQEYTTFGGITIKKDEKENENIALEKTVTVNSAVDSSSVGEMLVDGNKNTKWCATTPVEGTDTTYWAMLDLGQEYDISRWVVTHPVAGGENLPEFNTRDFQLQYSFKENPDGAVDDDWIAADIVEGNTDDLTDRNLENSIKARYVRLYVTKPTQNTNKAVRIYELELYQEPKNESDTAQEFRYEQDMKNAEVQTQSESGFDLKSWLSAKENILVTEITNVTGEELPIEVGTWTANANTTAKVEENMMISTKTGISKPKNRPSGTGTWEGWNVNVSMSSQIIGDVEQTVKNIDDKKNTSTFTLQPEQSVILVSAVEGGKQEGQGNSLEDAIQKSVSKLKTRLTTDEINKSNETHREYWKQYWLKSYINIEDEKVERLYYGTLYQLGCATSTSSESNGGIPTGLYPWTAVEHPGWQGDYTTNTDFQRQIHPLVQANRTEGIQNYVNIIGQYWPEAQRRSGSVDNLNWIIPGTGRPQFVEGIAEGALFPTHIGPWGASTEQYDDWRDYWNSPANATSVLMPVVKMWKYTRDDEFLKTTLYPMMKSVSTFWERYVTFEDGKYVVYGATHEGNPGRNPIFDIDACKFMLENTIEAAHILEVDSEGIAKWQDIVDNMSPVPTFTIDGKECIKEHEGRTPENPGNTFDGNPVTIQSVYYFDSIGMSASKEEKEKYYNYLARGNGMASPRRLNSAVRLGYDVNEIMEQMKKASIDSGPDYYGENGMRGNNTVGGVGMANILGMIQDSLLQSNEGFINIFANWYDNQETSFTRMGAENGFLVSADMENGGQVTYANIYSEKGQDCKVLNPWKDQVMKVYEDGNEITAETEENSLGTVYSFQTQAGKNYELKPDGNEDTSKAALEKLLNRAKQHVEDGDVDGLVESVKQLFTEAIEEGEAVMVKEEASEEEILNASMKLLKAIQALDFKAGDKADLGMALELAGMIDLTAYVEAGQTEYFKAKTDAEAVMANGDAMQEEVDAAWNTLVDAMMNLRMKADKAALEALLESIKTIDLTLYTEESVTVFSQARENANAVMANANLSVEEQSIVDDSVKNLQTAKDNLVLKTASGGSDNNVNNPKPDNGNNGGTGNNTGTNDKGQNASQGATIKTGDANSMLLPIVSLLVSLGLIAAAGAFMVRKRNGK